MRYNIAVGPVINIDSKERLKTMKPTITQNTRKELTTIRLFELPKLKKTFTQTTNDNKQIGIAQ